eukprot:TRINITY_DN7553_c0_g1_i1.p1 TRINITY_DN7553_c0_g1~~TRINITY_DN7553_c0_g1_i1.p1  ORF type:complete len:356 (+),score=77.55 TRINITY_DN7553_c0_g1_i1:51-1118(+)
MEVTKGGMVQAYMNRLMRMRVLIPSWKEVYLIEDEEKEKGSSEEGSEFSEVETIDRVSRPNMAPWIGAFAFAVNVTPSLATQGFTGFWANAKERLGLPSYRHFKTLWMSGELEFLDSFEGLVTTICKDRMVLLWGIAALATYTTAKSVLYHTNEEEEENQEENEGETPAQRSDDTDDEDATRETARNETTKLSEGPCMAVTYPLTVPLKGFQDFLEVAAENNARIVAKEVVSTTMTAPSDHSSAGYNIPVVTFKKIEDSIPQGYTSVGVFVGVTATEALPAVTVSTPSQLPSSPLYFIFLKSKESLKCDFYMNSHAMTLRDAASFIVKTQGCDPEVSINSSNPLSAHLYEQIHSF